VTNNSTPTGGTSWFQGNTGIFTSSGGASDSYIASNFLAANGSGVVSNWLISPNLTFSNGDVITFVVRTAGEGFLDTLETRLSTNGASSNVGATNVSVGDFTTLLGTYASNADVGWVAQSFVIGGLTGATSGRLAFHYVVANTATDGNYVGIDSLAINPVPEPMSALMLALGLSGLWLVRRRA
jgi:hypothetical protein